MNRSDAIVGGVLAVAFGALALRATALTYADEFAPGAGFAPLWLGAIGTLLSLSIVATAVRGAPLPKVDVSRAVRLLICVAALATALVISEAVGFIPAVTAALLVLTLVVERMSLVSGIAASVGTMAIVYVVFARLLDVPFPTGPLGF